jgi:hypothetical protein
LSLLSVKIHYEFYVLPSATRFVSFGTYLNLCCTAIRLQMWRQRKSWRAERENCWHKLGLDSLFHETPIIAPQKTNRSVMRCIWTCCFQAGVWNGQNLSQVVESQLFTSLWNGYHQWLSDIELNQMSDFSASCSTINPRFTAGKRIGVWICRSTWVHQKTTIFTSIVYVYAWPLLPDPRPACNMVKLIFVPRGWPSPTHCLYTHLMCMTVCMIWGVQTLPPDYLLLDSAP